MIHPFVAQYPGRCSFCGEYFDEGDSVAYCDDDLGHEDCARTADEETLYDEEYER